MNYIYEDKMREDYEEMLNDGYDMEIVLSLWRNNFAAKHQIIANEWDMEKNYTDDVQILAHHVYPGDRKLRWWLCPTCGHSWQESVHARVVSGKSKCDAHKSE
jgi:hypothetical protein